MAARLGLTPNGTRRMLNRLSRVVPAARSDYGWMLCGRDGSIEE